MAKKSRLKTLPLPVRIPEVLIPELDRAAAEEFDSRSGLMARIILDWLKARRQGKGKAR